MIKVSAVLSIHNRSELFRRALGGYLWQTMPPNEWEIILVDDTSTEDLSLTYRHVIGRVNLTHVRIRGGKHPLFAGFHTPAISTNVGVAFATGEILCLCHPEILHAPQNFGGAYSMLGLNRQKSFLFGQTYLGTPEMSATVKEVWLRGYWDHFLDAMGGRGRIPKFGPTELYWYTSFLPREAAIAVRGVDFAFLGGVAGEDDDFKERVSRAGWPPYFEPSIEGFHQDHSTDKDAWDFKRKFDPARYEAALERNRKLLDDRKKLAQSSGANLDCDWTGLETVIDVKRYRIGSEVSW